MDKKRLHGCKIKPDGTGRFSVYDREGDVVADKFQTRSLALDWVESEYVLGSSN